MGQYGGGWCIIKYEFSRMEFVEHIITIGYNFMNKDSIKYFKVFRC